MGPVEPYTAESPAAAYERFLPAAEQLAAADVVACNADVEVVRAAVDRGVAAVRPHLAAVRARLPLCPVDEILELPALAVALTFAAERAGVAAHDADIRDRLWTMITTRYAELREAGMIVLGLRALDARIPML